MITFNSLDDIINIDDTAVALGNFDGVYLEHQQLIKEMMDRARQRDLKPTVFTFSNHPKDLSRSWKFGGGRMRGVLLLLLLPLQPLRGGGRGRRGPSRPRHPASGVPDPDHGLLH